MFSKLLKKLRRSRGLTQDQLAAIIGVERSSVGKYESTNTIPSIDVLNAIADHFEVSIDYLLGRNDDTIHINDKIYRIRNARVSKNLTQQELAKLLGVSRSTIAMWETNASQPNNEMLVGLADYLEVSVDYLLGRTDGAFKGIHMNRISELRKLHKLSQATLGELVGAAQNTVCNWELGKREPDFETASKLASIFNVSIDYILGYTGGDMFQIQLKKLREKQGWSQQKLAELLNIRQSTVAMWENGTNKPTYATLTVLSDIFGVSLDELAGEKTIAELPPRPDFLPITTRKFPLLGEVACGQPIFADDQIECFIDATSDIHADFCIRANGDSMIGARIKDGDIVFIRCQPDVEDGEIAVVLIGDEVTLKRVKRKDGVLYLLAENPAYLPIVLTGEDEFATIRIRGKAVAFQSKL